MEWAVRLEAGIGWDEVTTRGISTLHRSLGDLTADGVRRLRLAETRALLAKLQQRIVQGQVDEYVTSARVRPDRLELRPLPDRRTCTLQTLSGTVKVVPRASACAPAPTRAASASWTCRCRRCPTGCPTAAGESCGACRANWGRHCFREAMQLLETFLPCSPSSHANVRNELHYVAGRIEAVEAAAPPAQAVRAALLPQSWQPDRPVTVINDGERVLLDLVHAATGERVRQIPDWWHLSLPVRHTEQALTRIDALRPTYQTRLDFVSLDVERLRYLIWNGHADEASQALRALAHLASEAVHLDG